MNGRTNSTKDGDTIINGALIPLEAPNDFEIIRGNASAHLSWIDPINKVANPGGELVSEWDHTDVIRKQGSAPASPDDGIFITKSTVKNQYKDNEYIDSNLTIGETYYYSLYAYSKFNQPSDPTTKSIIANHGEIGFYKDLTPISGYNSDRINGIATASNGSHVIFAGGGDNPKYYNYIDAYDPSLVKSNPATLPSGRMNLAGKNNGDSFILGWGQSGVLNGSTDYWYDLYSYNSSFTRSNVYVSGGNNQAFSGVATLGENTIFAGGQVSSRSQHNMVRSVTQSLTITELENLSIRFDGKAHLGSAVINNYAIFAGGSYYAGTGTCNTLQSDAYNASLTKVSIPSLSRGAGTYRPLTVGTTVGNNALFMNNSANTDTEFNVEGYTNSLTLIPYTTITQPPTFGSRETDYWYNTYDTAVSFGQYAAFSGSNYKGITKFIRYDQSLTMTYEEFEIITEDDYIAFMNAEVIGDYILYLTNSNSSNPNLRGGVKAYTMV